MTVSEIAALTAVILSVGTNVALYVHLSSVMNSRFDAMEKRVDSRFDAFEKRVDTRFDSVERRLELIQGDTHQMDIRITKLEK